MAATFVENALAKAIPVAIGFLASLLGLGDISGTIRKTIEKAQAPINKAIDWVIGKAVKLVKAAGGLFGGKKGDKSRKDEEPDDSDPQKAAKISAGLAAIDAADASHESEGKIERKDAEQVAVDVKRQHPIFKSITVVDGGATWDYDYVASPVKLKRGALKGASKQVKAGIDRLQALLAHEKIPHQYKAGIAAQVRRAVELHQTGKLIGVEVTQPGGKGRVDFEIGPPKTLIEYKYWTQEYTDKSFQKLATQLKKYMLSKKPVILELGVTKTKPITLEYVEVTLRAELETRGLTFDEVSISEDGQILSVSVKLQSRDDK